MNITITERAADKLLSTMDPQSTALKLLYDTDGCGCAVNGVPMLYPLDRTEPAEEEETAAAAPVAIFFETRQKVFFEEQLTLDFHPEKKVFVLKSDNQYYNPSISL